jgi:hypothetical protein
MACCEAACAAMAFAPPLPRVWSACLPASNNTTACHSRAKAAIQIEVNKHAVRTPSSKPTRRAASTADLHAQENPRQDGQHPAALHGCNAANSRACQVNVLAPVTS